MSYVSLYRRFRPDTFDKVVGQDHIVKTLTNQIESGRISHAYLFTGTRGTGKTTCAKIFARAVNCLSPKNGSPCGVCSVCKALEITESIDIFEIDAASNNGVDEIRDLRENVQYRPTYGKYKVYIIDEVHMLSSSAFNAFLKTLEEPPEHVIFILATTEVQKLPQTILSRCMRFDFRLVSVDILAGLLKKIFDEIGVTYDLDALKQIAVQGEGSVRDTLSLADMCLSYCGKHIGYADTLEILGATNFDTLNNLGRAILDGDVKTALETAQSLLKAGRNTIARDLANYFTDVIEVKNAPAAVNDAIGEDRKKKLFEAGKDHTNYRIARAMDIMAGMETALRYSTQPGILLVANIVRACELVTEINTEGLVSRIKELETRLKKLEEEGIAKVVEKVEIKEEKPAAVEQKAEIAEAPKPDVEKLLEEISEATEEKTVFEENEEEEDNGFLAHETWSKIIVKLADLNEMLLRQAAESIDDVRISDNTLIALAKDKITLELLRRPRYNPVLQKLVKEELGEEYNFVIDEKREEDNPVSKNRVLLSDIFAGKIKLK